MEELVNKQITKPISKIWASLMAQMAEEPTCNAGEPGSIPESGRRPGEGTVYPLQYSCLENAKSHAKSQT